MMPKWDIQFSFSGHNFYILFLNSLTNPTCPPNLTLIHFVTMRLSSEQYTSLLQISKPNSKLYPVTFM